MFAIVKDGTVFEGDTLVDLIFATNYFTFDIDKGQLFFSGKLDTVSYSKNYTPSEMVREMAVRAKTLLERRGWKLYKRA